MDMNISFAVTAWIESHSIEISVAITFKIEIFIVIREIEWFEGNFEPNELKFKEKKW